jgi:bifunctional DNA-binding transcriptional regulator/antitoxin component of YhaV-PrlF toxin-antitoxin module
MTILTVGVGGEVRLPDEVRERYGLAPEAALRVVETRGGILLVPQTGAPMSEELARELAEWQALGAEAWAMFGYEDEQA